MKVLIANRGEIARRIERTCVRLGHEVVGVFVEGDAGSASALVHSPVEVVPSYLDQAAVVAAAERSGATADREAPLRRGLAHRGTSAKSSVLAWLAQ